MRLIFALAAAALTAVSMPALAQYSPEGAYGTPYSEAGQIENIPVTVRINSREDMDDKVLIVSAYAAPDRKIRPQNPLLIGETRLLLTGLGPVLNLVVAAPEPVTRDLEAARISARIETSGGRTILESRSDGFYSGADPAILDMGGAAWPTTSPDAGHPLQMINGRVKLLSQSRPLPRGGTLTVKLVKNGPTGTPAAETSVSLDGKSAPYEFDLAFDESHAPRNTPLFLVAHITDWAGRITHETADRVPFDGPQNSYWLSLKERGALAGPPPPETERVSGEAQFYAYKGLPAGSRLEARLSDETDQTLARDTVQLDGLSGYIPYEMDVPAALFQNGRPQPQLTLRVVNAQNAVLFDSGKVPARNGINDLRLKPMPAYER